MKKMLIIGGGLIVLGVGVAYLIRRRMKDGDFMEEKWLDRWHVVTVNRPPDEVSEGGQLPDPLNRLGGLIVLEMRPAAGRRGTEIAGRLADPTATNAKQAVRRLRQALRETKLLLETGEILSPDYPTVARRTLLGLPIDVVTRRAREEGQP